MANLGLYGQDKEGSAWVICKMNMILHGVTERAFIANDDTLENPVHMEAGELMRFHRVLSNPPFSMNYDRSTLTHTERFTRYGYAPDTDPDYRFKYIDISCVDRGRIDWNQVREIRFCASPSRARRVVRPDDILVCTVRPGLQAHAFAGWAEPDGHVCSTGFAVLRAFGGIEPRFLWHVVFSEPVVAQLRRLEVGSNYPAVNEPDIAGLSIPDIGLNGQRRIAKVLDALDEAIGETQALIAKLRKIKAGLLHDLLTRGVDENGELRDRVAHPEQFTTRQLVSSQQIGT